MGTKTKGETSPLHTFAIISGMAFGVLVVILLISAIANPGPAEDPNGQPASSATSAAPAAPTGDATDRQLEAIQRDLDRRKAESEAELDSKPRTFVTDGTWEIGSRPGEMVPGTYRTSTSGCYWTRNSDATGSSDALLANGFTDGPAAVTVKPSDATFSTRGGCSWSRRG